MAFTLFDMQVAAHEKVGTIQYSLTSATGYGKTSLNSDKHGQINDQTESSAHADDQFRGGTVYFARSGDQTNTTAQWFEKRQARVLEYVASSGEFRFSTQDFSSASTGAASTGRAIPAYTEYGVSLPEFNQQLMKRLSNAAIRSLGPLVYIDRSLQTSGVQTVYELTTLASRGTPYRVDLMQRTGSSADYPHFTKLYGWYIEPSTAGTANRITFPRPLPSGRDVRIFFEMDHPELTASTQIIDGRIHPELAVLALVDKMYEFRNSRARGAQDFDIQRWNDAKRQFAEARVRWPIERPKKEPEILHIGSGPRDTGITVPPYGGID